ncbi:MAG: RidA family protein [Gammaproteobacteria bacterium]|jgi:enamine deaminase RidA (YjgF/YER057c/UK114 family)|nr:RidA family protein [Gammaproteobacteria bacterium]
MPVKKFISSQSQYEEMASYSRAVVVGDEVLVSGTTGFDYRTMQIAETAADQTEQCFINIAAALQQAGCSLDDVVRVRYIVAERDDFEQCLPVIRRYMQSARPAATMLVAGLLDKRMKIEIEVTARHGYST